MAKNMKTIYERLVTTHDGMAAMVSRYGSSICDEYMERIAEVIADDVARDVSESADIDEWNADDVRLAVGRVLCRRLGIAV